MQQDQTVMPDSKCAKPDGLWEYLQMATGAALVLFMCTHMMLVASVNLDLGGGRIMDAIAYFFEATYMAHLIGPAIFITMIAHVIFAARKLPFRIAEHQALWVHSKRFQHGDTWLWLIQAGTAFVILVLASIHIWTIMTNLPITAARSAARIQGIDWLLLYLVLVPCVELHVGIGAYRIGVKWGLIKRSNRKLFSSAERTVSTILILIGLLTLGTFYFLVKPGL